MKFVAITNGEVRKEEYHTLSDIGKDILALVPSDLLVNNEKTSLISDDGETISVYFYGDFDKFTDLSNVPADLGILCLKFNKITKEHHYKYSLSGNPLNVDMVNVVATGILSNNPDIVTVYTIDSLFTDPDKNKWFFKYTNYVGVTLNITTDEVLYTTEYDTQTFKD